MKKLTWLSLIVLFLFNSCIISRVAKYPTFNYSATIPKEVQVYYFPPAVPFEIIGEVTARGAPAASWGNVEGSMKKKAASIGGNAIVFIQKREQHTGTYTTPSSGNVFVYGNYIYYTYRPGTSMAMRTKFVVGLVIKWKN